MKKEEKKKHTIRNQMNRNDVVFAYEKANMERTFQWNKVCSELLHVSNADTLRIANSICFLFDFKPNCRENKNQ